MSSQFDESLVPEESGPSGQRLDDAGAAGGSPAESPYRGRDAASARQTARSSEPRPIDPDAGQDDESDASPEGQSRKDREPAGPEGPADPPIVMPESAQEDDQQ